MTVLTGSAQKQLKAFVERVERLEEEKKGLQDDIKSVVEELKASGFHIKTFRKVIALRRMDRSKREEEESLLDLYLHALGMTPIETAIAEAQEAAHKVSTSDPIARSAKKGGRKKKGEAPGLTLVGGDEKGGEASGEAAAAKEGVEPPPALAAGPEGRPAPMF
jgi:uncharacterized protein (UPF0335 family)